MGKTLVIVESPGKVHKIQDFLGSDYIVAASVGHIIDLDEKEMSVDIENDFKPSYSHLKGKDKVISDLKKLKRACTDILLATDEDREGEMIAWSLSYILDLKDAKRITFNSITETELLNAVKKPRKIDFDLVEAQKARRVLDRIVGFEISPILWKNMQCSLSAGRVQSVVVRLICDKETEIENFFKKALNSYFSITSNFLDNNNNVFKSVLYSTKKPKVEEIIDDEDEIIKKNKKEEHLSGYKYLEPDEKITRDILAKLQKATFKIDSITNKEATRNPSPPYTTSTLQQDAARKLGFAIKRTMSAAQNLYEAGHITYMRTDSVNLSKEAKTDISKHVTKTYGKNYAHPRDYKGKTSNAQEAHECIRPTHIEHQSISMKNKISSDELRLYALIWKRSIASQMSPAISDVQTTNISISTLDDKYFVSQVSKIKFDGFLKVYDLKEEVEDITLPTVGKSIKYETLEANQTYQRPPLRYNEAKLVNVLDPDNLNIGRPSTYAAIINKIQEKEYVKRQDHTGKEVQVLKLIATPKNIEESSTTIKIGEEKGKLTPTNTGRTVTNFLIKHFSDIMDYKFTATMEEKLDEIAEGNSKYSKVLGDFYKDFHKVVTDLSKNKENLQDESKRVIGKDPESGFDVVVTQRKYGPVVYIDNDQKKKNMAPIKEPLTIDTITVDDAIKLLSYPKSLGKLGRKEIKLHKGQYGLYVKYGTENISLKDYAEDEIDYDKVCELIQDKMKKYLWSGNEGKVNYVVLEGPYGKYINMSDKSKKTNKPVNTKLPQDTNLDTLTLEQVKKIIEDGRTNKKKFTRRFIKKK